MGSHIMKNITYTSRLFPLLIFVIFLFKLGKNSHPKFEYDSNYRGRKGIPIVHAHYELNEDNIKMLEKSNPPEVIQALREKLRKQKERSRLLKMQGLYDDHDKTKQTENKENDEEKKVKYKNMMEKKETKEGKNSTEEEYEEENINLDDNVKKNEKIEEEEEQAKYIPSEVDDDIEKNKNIRKQPTPVVVKNLNLKKENAKKIIKVNGDFPQENSKNYQPIITDNGKSAKKEKILIDDKNKINGHIIEKIKKNEEVGDEVKSQKTFYLKIYELFILFKLHYYLGMFFILLFLFSSFSLCWYYKKNKIQLIYQYDNIKKHKFRELEHLI